MTKKESLHPPSLLIMFEDILSDQCAHKRFNTFVSPFTDSKDWRDCQYFCHVDWLQPLIKNGRVKEVSVEPAWPKGKVPKGCKAYNYHTFDFTPKGVKWWIKQHTRKLSPEARESAYKKLILDSRPEWLGRLEGKGIGAEIRYGFEFGDELAAMAGIADGYFEFVDYTTYCHRSVETFITVRLTPEGMRFFDSLPRLQLECA